MSISSSSSSSAASTRKRPQVLPRTKVNKIQEPATLHEEQRPSTEVLMRAQSLGFYEPALLYGYLEHKKHFYTQSAFKIGLVQDWRFALVSRDLMFRLPWKHSPHVFPDGKRSDANKRQGHFTLCGSTVFPFIVRDSTNGNLVRVKIFALICEDLPLPMMIGEDSYLGRQVSRHRGQKSCVLSSPDTAASVNVRLIRTR